jgi:hypothetical protein
MQTRPRAKWAEPSRYAAEIRCMILGLFRPRNIEISLCADQSDDTWHAPGSGACDLGSVTLSCSTLLLVNRLIHEEGREILRPKVTILSRSLYCTWMKVSSQAESINRTTLPSRSEIHERRRRRTSISSKRHRRRKMATRQPQQDPAAPLA